MDYVEPENIANGSAKSTVLTKSTPQKAKFNDESQVLPCDDCNNHDRMRERITYFLLFLLFIVVVYGLWRQNYWLIGIICFPVIATGAYKVFDRYL